MGLTFQKTIPLDLKEKRSSHSLATWPRALEKFLLQSGSKVRVNVETGVVRDFAVNKGKRNGPASWLKKGGLERPVSAKFDAHGSALYVVDFGIVRMTDKGPAPQENTGVIWKITKQ
jgi:hypothetical protein